MSEMDIVDAMQYVDDDMILDAIDSKKGKTMIKRARARFIWPAVAACFVLAVLLIRPMRTAAEDVLQKIFHLNLNGEQIELGNGEVKDFSFPDDCTDTEIEGKMYKVKYYDSVEEAEKDLGIDVYLPNMQSLKIKYFTFYGIPGESTKISVVYENMDVLGEIVIPISDSDTDISLSDNKVKYNISKNGDNLEISKGGETIDQHWIISDQYQQIVEKVQVESIHSNVIIVKDTVSSEEAISRKNESPTSECYYAYYEKDGLIYKLAIDGDINLTLTIVNSINNKK